MFYPRPKQRPPVKVKKFYRGRLSSITDTQIIFLYQTCIGSLWKDIASFITITAFWS